MVLLCFVLPAVLSVIICEIERKPVSYTHLDVYKRQSLHWIRAGMFMLRARMAVWLLELPSRVIKPSSRLLSMQMCIRDSASNISVSTGVFCVYWFFSRASC